MNTSECSVNITGSFDRCLTCPYLGNGCSGPRTTAMSFDRWLSWIRALRAMRGYSYLIIAEQTGLAKSTVESIFSGKQKDVSRTSAGLLEDFLIGDDARWPCSMDLNIEKNIVYQDRPETLDALSTKTQEVETLNNILNGIHVSYNAELQTLREEHKQTLDRVADQNARLIYQNDQLARVIDKILTK